MSSDEDPSLSKPSLAQQFPLPRENGRSVSSLAYPSDTANCIFGLTPGVGVLLCLATDLPTNLTS